MNSNIPDVPIKQTQLHCIACGNSFHAVWSNCVDCGYPYIYDTGYRLWVPLTSYGELNVRRAKRGLGEFPLEKWFEFCPDVEEIHANWLKDEKEEKK